MLRKALQTVLDRDFSGIEGWDRMLMKAGKTPTERRSNLALNVFGGNIRGGHCSDHAWLGTRNMLLATDINTYRTTAERDALLLARLNAIRIRGI